jgi:hypothetical protein
MTFKKFLVTFVNNGLTILVGKWPLKFMIMYLYVFDNAKGFTHLCIVQ